MAELTEQPKEKDEQPDEVEGQSHNLSTNAKEASAGPTLNVGERSWYIFRGVTDPDGQEQSLRLPPAPPWRTFPQDRMQKGRKFQAKTEQIELVNAAIYLRRPLLVTGQPGTGKSSLADAVAVELGLGEVLKWPITSRSTLKDGLYNYDAIGRLQATSGKNNDDARPIGEFIRLGPLGTALADSRRDKPRVLLIDEIDKSDIDLPNDLLNVFEDGFFEIPELLRLARRVKEVGLDGVEDLADSGRYVTVTLDRARGADDPDSVAIGDGRVECEEFPIVILTSNGERELPAPFLRRCLRLEIEPPDERELQRIIRAHFTELSGDTPLPDPVVEYIGQVVKRRKEQQEYVATDQLLNAVHLILNKKIAPLVKEDERIRKLLEDFILETISTSLS